eukprot:1174106-Rhodomonas_salina.1
MICTREGSVIHPLYERYGDALDAGAKMLSDPDWYRCVVHKLVPLHTAKASTTAYHKSWYHCRVCTAGVVR